MSVRSQFRPGRAAEGEKNGIMFNLFIVDQKVAFRVPSFPHASGFKNHALIRQPSQPCAQERRGLQAFGKNAPAAADEGLDAEIMAPVAQIVRRE